MNKTPFFDTSRLFAWKQVYPNDWQRIAGDILATYLDVSKPYYNGSLRLYMEKDLRKLEKVLGVFRSASGDIGADLLRDCLAEMEASVKKGDIEKFSASLSSLNHIYFQTVQEMQSILTFLKMEAIKDAA